MQRSVFARALLPAIAASILAACESGSPMGGQAQGTGGTDGGGAAPDAGGHPAGDAGAHDAAPADAPADGHAKEAGADAASSGDAGAATDGSPGVPAPRVVAYLPNYSGSYATWATTIDFTRMTHLNLAFATASTSNAWDMGASDADVKALVDAAHAAGVKVLASLGGGGGDQTVIAQYSAPGQLAPLVSNLDAFVAAHDFDGVDVDIEDPSNLGAGYTAFVNATLAALRPEGKLVTAAVAEYLQDSHGGRHAPRVRFPERDDLLDLRGQRERAPVLHGHEVRPARLAHPRGRVLRRGPGRQRVRVLGHPGGGPFRVEQGQATVNGQTVSYTGMASMKKLADYARGFGGIMFWKLFAGHPARSRTRSTASSRARCERRRVADALLGRAPAPAYVEDVPTDPDILVTNVIQGSTGTVPLAGIDLVVVEGADRGSGPSWGPARRASGRRPATISG